MGMHRAVAVGYCCQPCSDVALCRDDASCCVECHITFEEQQATEYLPPDLRNELLRRHYELKLAGYPRDQMLAHSAWETPLFRRYCPPELCDQLEEDHLVYEREGMPLQP
jgi:hypothetical protein